MENSKVICISGTFLMDYYIKEVFSDENKNKSFIDRLKIGISIKYNIPIENLSFEGKTSMHSEPYLYLDGRKPKKCRYFYFTVKFNDMSTIKFNDTYQIKIPNLLKQQEKLKALKFTYETKIKFLDHDLHNCEIESQEIRMLAEQKAYRKIVEEIDGILNL